MDPVRQDSSGPLCPSVPFGGEVDPLVNGWPNMVITAAGAPTLDGGGRGAVVSPGEAGSSVSGVAIPARLLLRGVTPESQGPLVTPHDSSVVDNLLS